MGKRIAVDVFDVVGVGDAEVPNGRDDAAGIHVLDMLA
jgi:hypothetical protein